MTIGPVRVSRLPVARRCAPREASRLSSGAPPRCFESVSTTDVSLTSTRRKNTLFGDCPPSAVEETAGVPLRDPPPESSALALRPRKTPDHLAVIRPPTAPCLTAHSRLRVEWQSRMRPRAGAGRERGSFLGCSTPRLSYPLASRAAIGGGSARALLSSTVDLASAGCTSMRPAFARSRRLPPWESGSSTLAGTRLERRARWPTGAAAARVHRCSRTSTRPSTHRFRGRLLAACASTTSADRCFNEHCSGPREHPGPAENRGRDGCLVRSIVAFRSRQPPKVRRVRGRGTPSLGVPSGIAPERDFAPTPIASDTSCRGHCSPPCPE